MNAPIRVILAEDHTIVREGLRALLSARDDIEVIAEVGNGRAAVEAVAAQAPDVIVMDLGMPELNGVDATRLIRERHPGTQVLILSMHSSEEYVRPAIRADGGDVALIAVDGGTVRLSLHGACRGCPMAQSTLSDFVAERIRLYAPEITAVVAE